MLFDIVEAFKALMSSHQIVAILFKNARNNMEELRSS